MGVFEMVVAVVFIATVGKIVGRVVSVRRAAPAVAGPPAQVLEGQLEATELRLTQAEEKIVRLEEKLQFVESLLSAPGSPERLREKNEGG